MRISSPARATLHFVALVNSGITVSPYADRAPSSAQVRACVTRAVDAFLHGYGGDTDTD